MTKNNFLYERHIYILCHEIYYICILKSNVKILLCNIFSGVTGSLYACKFQPPSAVSGATINLDLHSSLFDIYWKFNNNR